MSTGWKEDLRKPAGPWWSAGQSTARRATRILRDSTPVLGCMNTAAGLMPSGRARFIFPTGKISGSTGSRITRRRKRSRVFPRSPGEIGMRTSRSMAMAIGCAVFGSATTRRRNPPMILSRSLRPYQAYSRCWRQGMIFIRRRDSVQMAEKFAGCLGITPICLGMGVCCGWQNSTMMDGCQMRPGSPAPR